jgi:hypothetical protein
MTGNKTVSVTLFTCQSPGWLYNNYCWYKQTTLGGVSCSSFCSSPAIGKTCQNNTQNGTVDDVVLSHFGYSGCGQTFSNINNILQINSSGGCYTRKTSGNVPITLTSSCSETRSWWGYICSCI